MYQPCVLSPEKDPAVYLSDNLTIVEACKSVNAIKMGIANTPNTKELANLRFLALHGFQPCRNHFGVPLYANSIFRNAKVNKLAMSGDYSHHRWGCAMDLDQDGKAHGITNKQVFDWFYLNKDVPYTELIWEFGDKYQPAWVHMAIVEGREWERKTKIAWYDPKEEKTKYAPFNLY